jgi:DNA-binding protein YbaB
MSSPIEAAGIEQLLAQTQQTLAQALGQGGDGADEDAEPIQGVGMAADGLIRIVAVPGGQLQELELDPRVMRFTTVQLAEEITAAANAALADLQAQLRERAAAPDLEGIADQLRQVQEQSVPELRKFIDALTDVQSRIVAGGR